jgi:hypothetical protein
MACSSGCRTPGAHSSWGECVKAKNLKTSQVDVTAQRAWDRNLDRYEKARKEGIQPDSTRPADIQRAVSLSDSIGEAYGA